MIARLADSRIEAILVIGTNLTVTFCSSLSAIHYLSPSNDLLVYYVALANVLLHK